jgi:ATP-binding cassette subfamily B protein
MNYSLDSTKNNLKSKSTIRQFLIFLKDDKLKLLLTLLIIVINSSANIIAPFILGYTINNFIVKQDLSGVSIFSLVLLGVYIITFISSYFQTVIMGRLGQDLLYKLRNSLFEKIQSLPLAFFNQNKLGDLISRINSDTDKLNHFFSQPLIKFVSNIFTIVGIGIFIFFLNFSLALVTVSSAVVLFIITYFVSPWINKKNKKSLKSLGEMSAEIQESLSHFKVIVAFNRRDYFRDNFEKANNDNFVSSIKAGIANTFSGPLYDLAGNIATLSVLVFGIKLILDGQILVGTLISFLSYTNKFYTPLRQMASLWSDFQLTLAAWSRIYEILSLDSDMPISKSELVKKGNHLISFNKVFFAYEENHQILTNISFDFDEGKTYAIVGPTGGGKSTIASLMSRLYDPSSGKVFYKGRNINSYDRDFLSQEIGFILQEQFLFSGTVGENICYGNDNYKKYSKKKLEEQLKKMNLSDFINKFENGLDTEISPATELISLGQKQLISFIRAIIRKPKLLIMDEATANIDTITESYLQKIVESLPKETTKVIIAHRLNTIKNANEIYFVNQGRVELASSYEQSLKMIQDGQGQS